MSSEACIVMRTTCGVPQLYVREAERTLLRNICVTIALSRSSALLELVDNFPTQWSTNHINPGDIFDTFSCWCVILCEQYIIAVAVLRLPGRKILVLRPLRCLRSYIMCRSHKVLVTLHTSANYPSFGRPRSYELISVSVKTCHRPGPEC